MGNLHHRMGRAPIGVAICIVCFLFTSLSIPAQTRPVDPQKERAPRQARLVEVFGGTACTDVEPDGTCTLSTASVIGEADATVTLVPTGNGLELPLAERTFPGERTLDPGVTLNREANEIKMPKGARRVFLEIRTTTWDYDDSGRLLRAFSFGIDASGYAGGLRGRLSPALVPCIPETGGTADDCLTAFGGRCAITGDPCTSSADCPPVPPLPPQSCIAGSRCDYPVASACIQLPNGWCEPGYFQKDGRPDWMFSNTSSLVPAPALGCFLGNPEETDFIYADATLDLGANPSPFPPDGAYAGTVVLDIPEDAIGTFTVGFNPDLALTSIATELDGNRTVVPTLALVPATIKIICQTAADCDDGNPCTRNECRNESCRNPDDFGVDQCCNPDDGTICERPAVDPGGDFDGDGFVTLADFRILQECFDRDAIDPPCTWVETVCDCTVDPLDVAGFIPLLAGPAP